MEVIQITLPDSLKHFVESQVKKGGYASTDEYVQRLIQQAEQLDVREKVDALLLEGLDSGEATPMDAADWERLANKVRRNFQKKQENGIRNDSPDSKAATGRAGP